MAKSDVTVERLHELLHYNPDTGVFTWRVDVMKGPHLKQFAARAGTDAGCFLRGYRIISIDNTQYRAHRLAFLYVTRKWPVSGIDHRNGDKNDNSWLNLREASQLINNQNQRTAQKHNKSGYLGVHSRGGKWRAAIRVDGKNTYLGYFTTPEAAHQAYVAAKRIHHEGCTL